MQRTTRLTCLTLSLLALSAVARAETTDCTVIASVPYKISAPGVYCLRSSVSGSNGIAIGSADVVLDLNGHTLEAPVDGVRSVTLLKDVTVRNGVIRAGKHAVRLQAAPGAGHLVVEGIRAEGNVEVSGNGSVVRNNVIVAATIPATTASQFAIQVGEGTGIRVSDNVVVNSALSGVANSGGIHVWKGIGAVIERNTISNTELPAVPHSHGIMLWYSKGATVVGNGIADVQVGIVNNTDWNPVLFRDNSVHGATVPFQGGVMAGSTNYSF